MKRYNIVVGRKYEKNGEEKTQWNNVGSLVFFPETEEKEEGYRIELNMFPNTKFSVFEQKPKEDTAQKVFTPPHTVQTSSSMTSMQPDGTPPIDIDDIPF